MSDESAWWTKNLSPTTGCKRHAIPREQRPRGCQACWMEDMLRGPRGAVIHGAGPDGKPLPSHMIQYHPGRLHQILTMKKPQRFGFINREPADVARERPEWLAAEVGVALARPDHGFGVPTSDPAAIVTWARWLFDPKRVGPYGRTYREPWSGCAEEAEALLDLHPAINRAWLDADAAPRNWIWLLSISTQQEADERLPHGVELGRMGWRWGVHAEPCIESLSIVPDAYGTSLADMPHWICSGPPKGHRPTDEKPPVQYGKDIGFGQPFTVPVSELDWHRALMSQCWAAGIPYFYKGRTLPGEALHNRALPGGWPA